MLNSATVKMPPVIANESLIYLSNRTRWSIACRTSLKQQMLRPSGWRAPRIYFLQLCSTSADAAARGLYDAVATRAPNTQVA